MAFNTVSLTGKFSLVTTVTISLILITVSAFSIYTARQNQRDMLDTFITNIDDMNVARIAEKKQLVKEKVEAMVNLMEKSAINLINSYDFDSVHEIALSGAQDSWIDYVIFYDSSDEKIGGEKNDQEATEVITRDIMYEESLLGKIEIGINYSSLQEQTVILKQQAIKASLAAEQKGALELKKLSYLIGTISFCGLVVLCSVIVIMFKGVVIKPITRVVSELSSVASQVNNASEEVAVASKSLADGAATQALAMEETSTSIEENTAMTRQNADNATQANSLMHRNGEVLQKAANSMSELTESMEEIANAGNDTQKIVKDIDEIAFQTNLLALNAAVEAARAGEAGAGFAVVADEVRNLALRAAEAARTTSDLIKGTVNRVDRGSDFVADTNTIFHELNASTEKSAQLVDEIVTANLEQANSMRQIAKAVFEIDNYTQYNTAHAEETTASADVLSNEADRLTTIIDELEGILHGSSKKAAVQGPSHNGSPEEYTVPLKSMGRV
jgi:methyl-accepting chemotaxis protein